MKVFWRFSSEKPERFIKCTQAIYKIQLDPSDPPVPTKISSLIPKENVEVILNKRQNPDSIVGAAGLRLEQRFPLVSAILQQFNKGDMNKSQIAFCSKAVLRSFCGTLFWNLQEVDPNQILVFSRALARSIPTFQDDLSLIQDLFRLFVERVYKIHEIDPLIQFLPSVNDLMTKNPKLSIDCPALHLETAARLCQKLEQGCPPSIQAAISVFLKNYAKSLSFAKKQNIDQKDLTKLIQQVLALAAKPSPVELLLSYFSLLLAFHHHNVEILPLLEKLSHELIDEKSIQASASPPSSRVINCIPLHEVPIKESFPPGFNFDSTERPPIPNLNELPIKVSKPAVSAASEISDHFLSCGVKELLPFVSIMVNSQKQSIQAVLIIVIMVLSPYQNAIAEHFAKNMFWNILMSDKNFSSSITYYTTPDSYFINFRQSMFDLISFLLINPTVIQTVRQSFCSLLSKIVQYPELAAEVLIMSYPQLKAIYTLPNIEDKLLEVLLEIAVFQQQIHLQDESASTYRIPTLSIILKILRAKESLISVANSQYACEALLSMMYERPLAGLIEKIAIKLLEIASLPKYTFAPFTSAVHQLFIVMVTRPDTFDLLIRLIKMIERNSTTIVLKSNLINDVYNAILACTDKTNQYTVDILESSFQILLNLRDFPEFDPTTAPFRSMAKVCSSIGMSDNLFNVLTKICIDDDTIAVPEGVQLLLLTNKRDDQIDFVLNNLINQCKISTSNRCSCLIGNVPTFMFTAFKTKMDKALELLKLIFYTICSAQSIRSFLRCFDSDSTVEKSLTCMLDIAEKADDSIKPLLQFTTVSSRVAFPQIKSEVLSNGFIINASILIDSENVGRNFFELRGTNLRLIVTFMKRQILYRLEYKRGSYNKTIDTKYPIKEWFVLTVLIKPSEGVTIAFNGQMKVGLTTTQFSLSGDPVYDLHFFTKAEGSYAPPKAGSILMNHVLLAADFQSNEVSTDAPVPADVVKSHVLFRYSADAVFDKNLICSKGNATFNAFSLPFASSFIKTMETTQSIYAVLSFFKKIEKMPSLFDDLVRLVFLLIRKSQVIANQMIEIGGFSVISHFIMKLESHEISAERWNLFIKEVKLVRNEPLLKVFARDIFYNFDIWSKAALGIQHIVISDWQKLGLFVDTYQTLPFMLTIYDKFTEDPELVSKKIQSPRSTNLKRQGEVKIQTSPIAPSSSSTTENGSLPRFNTGDMKLVSSTGDLYENTENIDNETDDSAMLTSADDSEKEIPINGADLDTRDLPMGQKRVQRSNSISVIPQKRGQTKRQVIRGLIIMMMNNFISRNKINNKDASFLFQAIHNSTRPEITLELLDVVECIVQNNSSEALQIEGSEWCRLFLHPCEPVRIKWHSIFAMVYPLPSPELTNYILHMMIIQSQRGIADETLSNKSILATCCRHCLYLKDEIDLAVTAKDKKLLCASPQYFHVAVAASIVAPTSLGDIFEQFFSSVCLNHDNVERIAATSSKLSLFILIYWTIKRSEKSNCLAPVTTSTTNNSGQDEIGSFNSNSFGNSNSNSNSNSTNRTGENSSNPSPQSSNQGTRRNSMIGDLLDENAIKLCAMIASETTVLLKTAIGIIDSIGYLTNLKNIQKFRSLFLSFVFGNIAKKAATSDDTLTYIQLIIEAIFFHHKIISNKLLKRMLETSGISAENMPKSSNRRRVWKIPDLISLVNAYLKTPNQRPMYFFSLSLDKNGCWTEVGLALDMIFFISSMKDERMRVYLTMLVYFFFQTQSSADSSPLLPLVGQLLRARDVNSFLILKALGKFQSPSLKQKLSELMEKQQKSPKMSTKKRRRHSDATGDLLEIGNLESSYEEPNSTDSLPVSSMGSIPILKIPKQMGSLIESPLMSINNPIIDDVSSSSFSKVQLDSQLIDSLPSDSGTNSILDNNGTTSGDENNNGNNNTNNNTSNNSNNNSNNGNNNVTDTKQLAGKEEVPEFLADYMSQNSYELCLQSLDQFCETKPKTIKLVHTSLIAYFTEMLKMMPHKNSTVLKYSTKRYGEEEWHHLSHQLFSTEQNHYRRSPYVDTSIRPILLKRNFEFNEAANGAASPSVKVGLKAPFEPLNENRIDSSTAQFETSAIRMKVYKVTSGSFYIINNNIRFIGSTGKVLEIALSNISMAMPMISLQRPTALEITTKNHRVYLFNFLKVDDVKSLQAYIPIVNLSTEKINELTDKWVHRQITNFEYLTWLNMYSGRTYNNAYSYPVFPWVLSDYTSQTLNLSDSSIYRDLSKPVGALNASRLEKLKLLRDDNIDGEMFLYRSTYSCAFHIFHYLVRLEPFTSLHISFQDGKFDVVSRLFSSVADSYDRVVGSSFNFRELIPEFFFCPEFLDNTDKYDFGEGVDNVQLPPYAKNSLHFIYLHRQALESEYVSAHLHEWIDLIWGFKQTGQPAEEADNVFDPKLYPTVWQNFTDPAEKEQIEELLAHVGQIPLKLFEQPHPKRGTASTPSFSFTGSTAQVYNSPIVCINKSQWTLHLDGKIYNLKNNIAKDAHEGCVINCALRDGFATVRKVSNEIYICISAASGSGSNEQQEDVAKIVVRKQHISPIVSICSIGNTIYTADNDGIITNEKNTISFAHRCAVAALCGSEKYSFLVSISVDGLVVLSSAQSLSFIRSFRVELPQGFMPTKLLICSGFGFIVIIARSNESRNTFVSVNSINGENVLNTTLSMKVGNAVSATGINEIDYIIMSDEKNKVHLFNAFDLTELKIIAEMDSPITAIAFFKKMNSQLFIGTENGALKSGTLSI